MTYISRGEQFDREKAMEEAGVGQFDLILMAAQRAREIRRENPNSDEVKHLHPAMTALLEIQSGKVDKDYHKKLR